MRVLLIRKIKKKREKIALDSFTAEMYFKVFNRCICLDV